MRRILAWLVVLLLVAGCGARTTGGSPAAPGLAEAAPPATERTAPPATPTMTPLAPTREPTPSPSETPTAPPAAEPSRTATIAVEPSPAWTATPEPSPTWTATPSPTTIPVDVVADLAAQIEALAHDPDSQMRFSGAVLIARDGVPVFARAYGLADRSAGTPNGVDTRFNLASMGKMFTATAIMQLVERGSLSLEDRIIDYLPDYPNQAVAEQVTIRQLLTHTAGMGDVFTEEYTAMSKDELRTVEAWLPLFVDAPLLFEPGTGWAYSNAGYVVLGLIIERVSGQAYYDFVRDNIFLPSGMADTDAYELDAGVPNLAIGYTGEGAAPGEGGSDPDTPPEVPNTSLLPVKGFPAGGSYSTVEDLLRFGSALMRHQLLSPASTEELLQGREQIGEGRRYAYGFFDDRMDGQRAVGHTGGFPGICDFMYIYPELGYTVIALSNVDGGCVPLLEALREQPWGAVAPRASLAWGADWLPAPRAAEAEAGALRMTIVYDNVALDERFSADWGFSAWLEYGGHVVLFDTGANGAILLGNMEVLGLDPHAVEIVVLSHIHGDHTGGLQALLDRGAKPTVYVPASFSDSFNAKVRAQTRLVEVFAPLEILPGLYTTGEVPGEVKEQGLVVETSEGLVIVTGCAHPGILNMVGRARQVVAGQIALVVGGFHLGSASGQQIRDIVAGFRDYGVRQVSPTHCTGAQAKGLFRAEYGDDYVRGGVGQSYVIGSAPP